MSLTLCANCHQHYTELSCPHCVVKTSAKIPLAVLMGFSLTACPAVNEPQALYGGPPLSDIDSDDWFTDQDCDDTDPQTYPGAAPLDSEDACMQDFDGDGYGNDSPDNPNIEPGTDCDDTDPTISPEAGNCP